MNFRTKLEAMQQKLFNVKVYALENPDINFNFDIYANDRMGAVDKAILLARNKYPQYHVWQSKKESLPNINSIQLASDWGSCKANSDKLQKMFGGQSKQIALATEVDGIDGHYYWTDGTYVVDKVIKNQPQAYNVLKSKEIKPGVWKYRDYINALGIQD